MKRETGEPHVIVICGMRNYTDREGLYRALDNLLNWVKVKRVITGGCRGTDALAKDYAEAHGYQHREVKANWVKHGRKAGPLRNREMAKQANATVAVWDGISRGTKSMLDEAKKAGHEYIAYYNPKTDRWVQL